MSFEEWVKFVFDRPTDHGNGWYFDIDVETEPVPPPTYVDFTTRLFQESGVLLRPFSDAQVDLGLNFLVSNHASNNIFALQNETIPIAKRIEFVRAILDLNRQCFETRCTPHLSHLDRQTTPDHVNRLNMICYMWWDTFIAPGRELNEACLWVMENSLQLSNPAVIEGALHGLGHWTSHYPDRCAAIIENFLETRAIKFSEELHAYATWAQSGCIQ
jgi:hypothetical protein